MTTSGRQFANNIVTFYVYIVTKSFISHQPALLSAAGRSPPSNILWYNIFMLSGMQLFLLELDYLNQDFVELLFSNFSLYKDKFNQWLRSVDRHLIIQLLFLWVENKIDMIRIPCSYYSALPDQTIHWRVQLIWR